MCFTALSRKWEVILRSPEFRVLQPLRPAAHDHFPYSLFPSRNHITPPSSPPRCSLSILSQSHLVNMSRSRLTDPISGDGGAASEAETRHRISQRRLTGERGGGNRDGKRRRVFFSAVTPCCVTSARPRGSTRLEEGRPNQVEQGRLNCSTKGPVVLLVLVPTNRAPTV